MIWGTKSASHRGLAAQHFFAQPEHAPQGTERELAKVSDQVLDCVDLREHELAAVMQFWLAMTTTH